MKQLGIENNLVMANENIGTSTGTNTQVAKKLAKAVTFAHWFCQKKHDTTAANKTTPTTNDENPSIARMAPRPQGLCLRVYVGDFISVSVPGCKLRTRLPDDSKRFYMKS